MRVPKLPLLILILAAHFAPRAAGADFIAHFTVPATADGIRGKQGLPVFKGLSHPRSRHNFTTSAVFSDPDLPNNVVMIATTGDSTRDAAGNEVGDSDTHEILFGRSVDGGTTFYFRRVLRWTNGMRIVRVAMVPDPSRHLVWSGLAQVVYNEENSPDEDFRGTTRIEIDLSSQKVRLLNTAGTGWVEYSLGTLNAPQPGFVTQNKLTHVAQVTVNGAQRYEAWGTETAPRSTPQVCPDDPQYQQNIAAWAPNGVRIVWYRFDPVSGLDLGSKKYIASSLRGLPTDNPRSDRLVARGELGTEEFLFVGTQDQTICEEVIGTTSNGSSVRFIGLVYNAGSDNYTEVEHKFLFNIAAPTLPNWTCADPSVFCKVTSNTRLNYAFVGAIPYKNGTTMQIYSNVWGSFTPSLPVIGEAGTVQVDHTPKVVTLSRTYVQPVVFVQPATYVGGRTVVARVTAVNSNNFSVRLQEDSSQDDIHNVETLSYVVLERGTYRLLDRRVLEVDKLTTSRTMPAVQTWSSKLDLRDTFGADTGAVVMTQLQTANDPYFAKMRQIGAPTYFDDPHQNPLQQSGSVRNAQVSFGIENDEKALSIGRQHGSETVGILLLGEKWLGRGSSIYHLGPSGASGFDVGRINAPGGTTGISWHSILFKAPHLGDLANPVLLAWPESRLGTEPVGLRYRSLSPTGVELTLDEDESLDAERDHGPESIVYWVIGKGNGLIRGQPITLDADHVF